MFTLMFDSMAMDDVFFGTWATRQAANEAADRVAVMLERVGTSVQIDIVEIRSFESEQDLACEVQELFGRAGE